MAKLDRSSVPGARCLDPGPSHRATPGDADAARNRAKILAAAQELFANRDPRTVTMEDIARAAGVGQATVYRRYPDPASVAVALLDEHERHLQSEPDLRCAAAGTRRDPSRRLAAFYEAMIELLEQHLPLVLGAETGDARLRTGAYQFWRLHVRSLTDQAGMPNPDALADML